MYRNLHITPIFPVIYRFFSVFQTISTAFSRYETNFIGNPLRIFAPIFYDYIKVAASLHTPLAWFQGDDLWASN